MSVSTRVSIPRKYITYQSSVVPFSYLGSFLGGAEVTISNGKKHFYGFFYFFRGNFPPAGMYFDLGTAKRFISITKHITFL